MSAEHVVVGIDLGSSRFVISVGNNSGVDVMVNQASYRQTPTAILFGEERSTGDKATSLIRRDLDNAIFCPTRFLGDVTHEGLRHEMQFNYCSTFFQTPGVVGFDVSLGGQKGTIRAEQLVAAIFSEVMTILKFNNVVPKETVVSVPDHYGQVERQSLLTSARIAGLPITKLLNESSANALNYSIFRRNEFDPDKPRVVAFVDVGHSKTSVAFAAITTFQIEILATYSNPKLGCRDLDYLLAEFYAKQLLQRFKLDVKAPANKKVRHKLMEAVTKQRTTLTINSEAQLVLECVSGDQDYSYLMKRDEMEKVGAPFFKALKDSLEAAVKQLPKAHAKSLHSVERVGGGCRMPAVERLIGTVFKVAGVSKTLDASESIARGCAIQSAMMSPKMVMSNYKLKERLIYPITVKTKFGNEEASGKTLFEVGSELPRRLSINIQRPEAVTLALCVPSKSNFEESVACHTTIPARDAKTELTVYFLLDHNGVVFIENAVLKPQTVTQGKNELFKPLALTVVAPRDMTPQEVQAFQKFEVDVLMQESMKEEREAARNRLEARLYSIKSQLKDDRFGRLWTREEAAQLNLFMDELEGWLYKEGAKAPMDTYVKQVGLLDKEFGKLVCRGDLFTAIAQLGTHLAQATEEAKARLILKGGQLSATAKVQADDAYGTAIRIIEQINHLRDQPNAEALLSFDLASTSAQAMDAIQSLAKIDQNAP